MHPPPLRLASRSSPLALHQARLVGAALEAAEGPGCFEIMPLESRADRELSVPIAAFSERGVFVAEIEQAVLEGRADVAVHSAKDLPSSAPPAGLVLAAVPARGAVGDALVGSSLDQLRPGALIATGSVRRRVQLASYRPDLGFVGLRGNIGTRIAKVPSGGAAVVALAALERLGLLDEVAEVLPLWLMLPQIGQGALALRCREGDGVSRERLAAVDDPPSHRAVRAERAFLARLGGGCEAPVAALATVAGGALSLEAMLAGGDGHVVLRARATGQDPEGLGGSLAEQLIGMAGGASLLGAPPAA